MTYVYALKECIKHYKSRNTTVCVTFLDASKAFDRIEHWLLFKKLIAKDVPLFIIRLRLYQYSHQQMCIRWGNTFSSLFSVKQGGILSPALINIYMDGLSTSLDSSNIGGHICGNLWNHLCYADDMCLISLSSAGMQRLLNM